MNEEQELSISLPLDTEGFLRRECPTCEREFKWLPSREQEPASESVPESGYHCPYCAIQAPVGAWWTKPQLTFMNTTLSKEFIEPRLRDLERSLQDMARRSRGLVSVRVESDEPAEMSPLVEMDDMRRIDFECHPSEPVKVLDDWNRPVHCLICGGPASSA